MIVLTVATPMYGGQCYGAFMEGILALKDIAYHRGWKLKFIYTTNESLITRARNKLVEQFLTFGGTHLLFLDADQVFNPHQIANLIDYDVDIVCGMCPKKFIRWDEIKSIITSNPNLPISSIAQLTSEYCVNYYSDPTLTKGSPEGLIRVKHAGTGCMLIKRTVFEKLEPHLPKFTDYGSDGLAEPKQYPLYFDTKVEAGDGPYLSEDYYFCAEWNKIGGKIYVAYGVKLQHIGSYTFG